MISPKRYEVTDIDQCIIEYGSFDECFNRKVTDNANAVCVGNAYNAMYADLAMESGRVALQFSVHPFSNRAHYKFTESPLSQGSKFNGF